MIKGFWLVLALVLLPTISPAQTDRDANSRTAAMLTIQYLRTLSPDAPGPGLAYWDQDALAKITADRLTDSWRQSLSGGVAFDRLQPLSITWYDRPDGLFGAVDLSSTDTAETFACGYLVWRKNGKDMKLVRAELNHIGPDILPSLDRTGLQQLTQTMGCRRFVPPNSVPK